MAIYSWGLSYANNNGITINMFEQILALPVELEAELQTSSPSFANKGKKSLPESIKHCIILRLQSVPWTTVPVLWLQMPHYWTHPWSYSDTSDGHS